MLGGLLNMTSEVIRMMGKLDLENKMANDSQGFDD